MDAAKRMRKAPTDAEHWLWERLRNQQAGFKFRRQHRVGGYIVDFICVERGLVVEVDGGQHADAVMQDATRTTYLQSVGLRVIRFWNHEVLKQTDEVMGAIWHALHESPPHPNPLPRRRGRGGRSNSRDLDVMTGDEKTPGSPEQEVLPSRDATNANATSPPQAGERVGVRGSAWTPDLAWTPDIADQSWAPTAPRDALRLRARLNRLVREFFHAREVLEVETPMMSRAGNTDPNIASFSLDFSGRTDGAPRTRWLRTSPEFPLKRLLAAGIGDCYELGRVFRDGEAGGRHNPEFTMLEWYRVGWTLEPLIDETVALVQAALAMVGREAAASRFSFRALYQQRLGFDPMTAELETVRNAAAGIAIDGEGLTRDDWLDLLMTHVLQPTFGRDEMLVVHDYPATQSALARVVERDGVPVAERFELYLGPLELANGYHELTDAVEQRARFERDVAVRQARGNTAPPIDAALLDALANGMPACAGVALGVDRLLMAMRDTARIADVVAFDFARG